MGKKITLEQAFGIALRKARAEAELSQEQLALESGYDRTYISMLERGLRNPSLKTIFTVARILKISPTNIIDDVENLLK